MYCTSVIRCNRPVDKNNSDLSLRWQTAPHQSRIWCESGCLFFQKLWLWPRLSLSKRPSSQQLSVREQQPCPSALSHHQTFLKHIRLYFLGKASCVSMIASKLIITLYVLRSKQRFKEEYFHIQLGELSVCFHQTRVGDSWSSEMTKYGFGQFEWSVSYYYLWGKIVVFVNGVWWLWGGRCSSGSWLVGGCSWCAGVSLCGMYLISQLLMTMVDQFIALLITLYHKEPTLWRHRI